LFSSTGAKTEGSDIVSDADADADADNDNDDDADADADADADNDDEEEDWIIPKAKSKKRVRVCSFFGPGVNIIKSFYFIFCAGKIIWGLSGAPP
jgi:hypothetical protein